MNLLSPPSCAAFDSLNLSDVDSEALDSFLIETPANTLLSVILVLGSAPVRASKDNFIVRTSGRREKNV